MPSLDHFSLLAPLYEKFIPPRLPERLLQLTGLPVDGAILDAGGGTGRLAQFLRGKASRVVLADETLQMTLQARQKDGLLPVCAQTERLPFGDRAFERIIMVDALHHVTHQSQTIRELWRILAPGGRIVIEEPDIRVFAVKLIAIAEKLALMRSHFLSSRQIENLFPFPNAIVHSEAHQGSTWIIAHKQVE